MTALAFALPHGAFDNIVKASRVELESSGSGPDDSVRGIVKVLQLDPHAVAHSGYFRRGLIPRRAPSASSRFPFPAFLSQGRPGLAPALKARVNPLHHLHPERSAETELKKRQGLQMWQRAINKGEMMPMPLPVNLKDTKQTCSAVPFTQVRFLDHELFFNFRCATITQEHLKRDSLHCSIQYMGYSAFDKLSTI